MSELERHRNYIGGRWTPPQTGRYYTIHNPAQPRQLLGEFPSSGVADADAAVAAAAAAREGWAATPGPQRGAVLYRFAQLLEESKAELSRIVTLEQGKAIGEAAGEVGRAAIEARYMAGEASRPIGQTFPSERAGYTCQTIREPIGVVTTICPWNFPVVTPVRKIAPALAYGNTVVHKPASLTPWTSVYLVRLLERAGLPSGVVNWSPTPACAGSALPDRATSAPASTRAPRGGWPAFSWSWAARIRPSSSTMMTSTAPHVKSSAPHSFAAGSAAQRSAA
jgi:aldehyde dehydrogenase (NAD+)